MSAEDKKKHGAGAFLLAGVSFIPLIGVFTGIICIVIAIVGQKSNSKLLGSLGIAGVMLSVVLYGSLFYKMFNDNEYPKGFEANAISAMTFLIRQIEYYKLQNGAYPESMIAIRESLQKDQVMLSYDVSGPMTFGDKPRDFYYEVRNEGENYLLFGVGRDGMPFTEDDIFPNIDREKDKNIGWVIKAQ